MVSFSGQGQKCLLPHSSLFSGVLTGIHGICEVYNIGNTNLGVLIDIIEIEPKNNFTI